ncbi:MAG: hypothetical protein ABSF55_00025 [Candidatus Staskawiczbacteria bacterium]|jgi:hypothetical protein
MIDRKLLDELCAESATLELTDGDLIDSSHRERLGGRINDLRTELLTRMGGGTIEPGDELELQGYVDSVVRSVNSGKKQPADVIKNQRNQMAKILVKASRISLAKALS